MEGPHKALEDDVVGLSKAHDEHGVDYAKSHEVLGQHPDREMRKGG